MKNAIKTNKLTSVLFVIYLIVLFWILLFKFGVQFSYMERRSVSLIPFNELFIANGKLDLSEIILNMVIFVPLGIYAGVLFQRWTWKNKFLFFFLMSFMFEALQFILRIGAFDITDIITNTSGGVIGLLIYEVVEKLFNNRVRAKNFINVVATAGTIVMVSLLILLKLQMLPIRYQ
jgi:glycopeptide antibiotics resistance protein